LFPKPSSLLHREDKGDDDKVKIKIDKKEKEKGKGKGKGKGKVHPALRALWVFFFSALLHGAWNWVAYGAANLRAELTFFLINFAVCYVETMVGKMFRSQQDGSNVSAADRKSLPPPSLGRRLLGYLWVYGVFFILTPAWQWSMAWIRYGHMVL